MATAALQYEQRPSESWVDSEPPITQYWLVEKARPYHENFKTPELSKLGLSDFITIVKGFSSLNPDFLRFIEEAPSHSSIQRAIWTLSNLGRKGQLPTKVSPSPDGGVMIEKITSNNYFLIEFYNDGDIVFLKRKPDGQREAFDLEFEELLEKIENDLE